MRREGRKGYSAKRSSDPPGSLPRSQSSGTGPSVSCGYCCPLCPTGGWGGPVFGENLFYRALGGKWAQETCAGCPHQQYATGGPGKIQGWAVWGL